jgi:ATP-dependent Clp protease ATP-binding subunit ClpB
MALLSDAVTERDIVAVVSKSTGIPLTALLGSEKERLLQMESFLNSRVVGQQEAVGAISNAVRIARAGLHPHSKPLGTFLFLGPTGVGYVFITSVTASFYQILFHFLIILLIFDSKTELCKQLSDFLFFDKNAMTRIDMSEYMERFSVSRLIGAPPGYVGYEEGGTLTESVRRRPYQIVLFDEFEKAHREVSNLLLQVLDEGFLTDSQGRKVDFRNTIVSII